MWLELFGPPGVGKSHLRKAILRSDKFKVALQSNCKAARLDHLISEPKYWDLCVEVQALYEQHAVSKWRRTGGPPAFARRIERVVTAMRLSNCVVFDEALLQAALSYSYAIGHDEKLVREFVRIIPLPQLALACTATPEIILERNARRGAAGGNDRSHDALDSLPLIPVITEEVARRGTEVLSVDLSDEDSTYKLVTLFRKKFNATV